MGGQLKTLLEAQNDFDTIVLQDYSSGPLDDYAAFAKAAESLQTLCKTTQKAAVIRLYATWGFTGGENPVADPAPDYIPAMEARLRAAYSKLGSRLGIAVTHVGRAFTEAWRKLPAVNLYDTDNKHPSYAGSYLAACVHCAAIYAVDSRTITFDGNLDKSTARSLRQLAWTAV
jgi:hypothetical protein